MPSPEEIAATLAEHKNRIAVSENRIKDLESQTDKILDISVNIEKLACNMESMLQEQRSQGMRLKKLEDEPTEKWNSMKKTAFTSIVSVIAGAIATYLISIL